MALPDQIQLEIVTPEKRLFSGKVDEVTVPSSRGYLGILPGHAPLLGELGIGEISCRIGDRREYFFCADGFLEVLPDRVVVLAQVAERASEIDVGRAEQAKLRAEKLLASKDPETDYDQVQTDLKRATARLETARHQPRK
jgi:F-type H+-transporting ATPase subunit epsilon